MTDIEIASKFISDLRNTEQDGGVLCVPICIKDWKRLDDGSYIVIMDEKK